MSIDLKDYQAFVASTTSDASSDFQSLIESLYLLNENEIDVKIPQLLTGAVGLSTESGEFLEIIKKLVFQGKPLTEDIKTHLTKELGDVCWYLAIACAGLGVDINDVLVGNVEKLSARFPNGFEIIKSEVRKEGDI